MCVCVNAIPYSVPPFPNGTARFRSQCGIALLSPNLVAIHSYRLLVRITSRHASRSLCEPGVEVSRSLKVKLFFAFVAPRAKRPLEEKFSHQTALSPSRSVDSQLYQLSTGVGAGTPSTDTNL